MSIQRFLFTNNVLVLQGQGLKIAFLLAILTLFQGCVAVNTFPQIARPDDTVSVMIGGTELARKDTIDVQLIDYNGITWDLQALGLVRSVFNLRPEGRAYGLHYSNFLSQNNSWKRGHEPLQTVLVFDVPDQAAYGPATLLVTLSLDGSVDDDSSGIVNTIQDPFTIALDIVAVPGQSGVSDNFVTKTFDNPAKVVDFGDLEPAPHAKISFGRSDPGGYSATSSKLYAAEIVVDFDEAIVSGDDLNVYVAEPVVRGSLTSTGAHGKKQRSVTWKHDGDQITIYVIAPNGIGDKYLQVYVMHPKGLPGDPGLSLVSTNGYDADGGPLTTTPQFSYYSQ